MLKKKQFQRIHSTIERKKNFIIRKILNMNLFCILNIAILLKLASARLNHDLAENPDDEIDLKHLRRKARLKHTGKQRENEPSSVIKVTNGYGIETKKYEPYSKNMESNSLFEKYKPNPETKRMYRRYDSSETNPDIPRSTKSKHW